MNIELLPSQHEPDCTKCKLSEKRRNIVPSYLPKNARVMFIAQAPGQTEDQFGTQPLIGVAGQLFNSVLSEVGIDRTQVAICNVCRCAPPNDAQPKPGEIKQCLPYLLKEIEMVKPDLIIPLGGVALSIFGYKGGITLWRGKFLKAEQFNATLFPMYHPSFIDRNRTRPELRKQYVDDMAKIYPFLRGEEGVKKAAPTYYQTVDTVEGFLELIKYLKEHDLIALDTETTSWDFLNDQLLCISFSCRENSGIVLPLKRHKVVEGQEYHNQLEDVFTPEQMEQVIWPQLREVLNDSSVTKILQNYSFDLQFLRRYGITMNDPIDIEDTMLMHYTYNPEPAHDLKSMALMHTDMGEYDKFLNDLRTEVAKKLKLKKEDCTFDYVPDGPLWHYSAADADATFRMYHYLKPKLVNEGMYDVYRTFVMPTRWVLNDVEWGGVSIDIPYLDDLVVQYKQKLVDKLAEIQTHPEIVKYCTRRRQKAMDARRARYKTSTYFSKKYTEDQYAEEEPQFLFNPNSHTQLTELIIDQMGLKKLKESRATGNPSFDNDTIQLYAKQHPFMKLLAEYRSLVTMNGTYVVGMRSRVSTDNKIRTDYLVHGTVTGRLSSRDPNLQNLPRDAYDVQRAFVSDTGCLWVAMDWKQAEFRCWANFSQDPQMLRDINAGHDIHKLVAALGSGVQIPTGDISKERFKELTALVTKPMRQVAKDVVFGVMFGRGPASVAEQLGITEEEAVHVLDVFFSRYPTAKGWIVDNVNFARLNGYTKTFFGRRRFYPDINAREPWIRQEAERQATNMPIQGTATDITNAIAASRIKWQIEHANPSFDPRTRQIMTIHDALYFNVAVDDVKRFVPMILEEATRPIPNFSVKLEVEMKIGESWESAVEVSSDEIRELVS